MTDPVGPSRTDPFRIRGSLMVLLLVLGATRVATAAQPHPITEFGGLAPGALPIDIVLGPDNNLWFTEFGAYQIGRMTAEGVVVEFPASTLVPPARPVALCVGADRNVWFTYSQDPPFNQQGVAVMSPQGVLLAQYDLTGSTPQGIASSTDGTIWVAAPGFNAIVRIREGGAITLFPFGAGKGPRVIKAFAGGVHYVSELTGDAIAAMQSDGSFVEFPIPTPNSGPVGMTLAFSGIWFAESNADQIGRIGRGGAIAEFPVTAGSRPWGMLNEPTTGGAWFCEFDGSRIGYIDRAGRVTEFPTPTPGAGPRHMVVGPDGEAWFTETFAGKIGRIVTFPITPLPF